MATTHTRFRSRGEFDASRDFVVRKDIKVGGIDYRAGEAFDKHAITVRRLRQIWEMRAINMKPEDEPARLEAPIPEPAPIRPRKPPFRRMDDEDLRGWLADQGAIPRVTWQRPKLLERCNEVWNGLKAAGGHA